MDTNIFKYLLAVEEEKNITKAAEKCYISQPALTKNIRTIEKRIGFPLFEKTDAGIIPTAKGKVYLNTARRLLNIEQETMKKIQEYKEKHPETRTLFVDSSLYHFFLSSVYPVLTEEFPETVFSVLATDAQTALGMLSENRNDTGIFPFLDEPDSGFHAYPFDDSEFVFAYPQQLEGKVSIRDGQLCIDDEYVPPVLLCSVLTFNRSLQDRLMEKYRLYPEHTKTVSTLRQAADLIRRGEGIGMIPYWHAERYHCSFLSFDPPVTFRFYYLYSRSRDLDAIDHQIISIFVTHTH